METNTTYDIDYTYVDPSEVPDEPLTIHIVKSLLDEGVITITEFIKFKCDSSYIPKLKE